MTATELVLALREIEVKHRFDGHLDAADLVREMADAFERNGGEAPLACEIPTRARGASVMGLRDQYADARSSLGVQS